MISKYISAALYYLIARRLPVSNIPAGGVFRSLRVFCVRRMVDHAGDQLHVQRGVYLGTGRGIRIGNSSSLGIDCELHGPLSIGSNVMMGSGIIIHTRNHRADALDVPIGEQGYTESQEVVIEDNVWIGTRVIILPGVRIGEGSIVGAGAVVSKSFPAYSIIAGNPAQVVRSRVAQN
jgi:maltose O-acetyltransferase